MVTRTLAREQLEEWFEDELKELEDNLKEGHISDAEYNKYLKNLNKAYKDDLYEIENYNERN